MKDITSTAAGAKQELNNARTDDPYEKAAVQGALAALHNAPFEPSGEVSIKLAGDEHGIAVSIALV